MDNGKSSLKKASFRFEGICLCGRSPRTWPSATLLEVHIESKTPKRRKGHGAARPNQFRSLRSTKAAFRTSNRIRPQNVRIEDFRRETAPDKTLYASNSGEHARMLLAIFGVKIGFCLLQESSFRFLRV